MTTVSEEIAKLQGESQKKQSKIDWLAKLFEIFSPSVNSKVTRFNLGPIEDFKPFI